MKRLAGLAVAAPLVLLTACAEDEPEWPEPSIDLGPGETQDEQIDELETFVESMSTRLGEEYRLRESSGDYVDVDEWTPAFHEENRPPSGGCGEDGHHHALAFDYPGLDAEEAYSDARELVENLGFLPNEAVNNDASDGERMNFTAVDEEDRLLIVRQQRGDDSVVEVFYETPCSDHQSLQDVADEHLEEYKDELRERSETD